MYVAEGVDLGLGCHRFREEFGMVLAVLVAQQVRNLPAMQSWVRSLGWEGPPRKGMATRSSILAGRILWTEEPATVPGVAKGRTQPKGLSTAQHTCFARHMSRFPGHSHPESWFFEAF